MNDDDGPEQPPGPSPERTARIRALNDRLRQTGLGGRIMLTSSITERGRLYLMKALSALAAFDAFNDGNDPYGEHDFGGFEVDGETLLFKIDYYDPSLTAGASDPSDPQTCVRVLTLMTAADY